MNRDADGVIDTLLRTAWEIQSRLERAVEEHGLSTAKLSVLQQLYEAGGALPLGQLAERLRCVRSNITQLVDRLEAEGLVQREPDPEDRRSTRAVLTPLGRQRFDVAGEARRSACRALLKRFPAEQRAQLEQLLAGLLQRAG